MLGSVLHCIVAREMRTMHLSTTGHLPKSTLKNYHALIWLYVLTTFVVWCDIDIRIRKTSI